MDFAKQVGPGVQRGQLDQCNQQVTQKLQNQQNLKQQGLAGYDSWYSRPEPEYTLPADREYKWGFTLIPGAKANSAQKKAGYSYK